MMTHGDIYGDLTLSALGIVLGGFLLINPYRVFHPIRRRGAPKDMRKMLFHRCAGILMLIGSATETFSCIQELVRSNFAR